MERSRRRASGHEGLRTLRGGGEADGDRRQADWRFPTAHQKEGGVRWRFVATEINKHEVREDNHFTPQLMIARATLSRAASSPTSTGGHKRMIQVWGARKVFFNADLGETIYVHPGRELRPPG
eukprot:7085814-Pyramimonas_sp.AAC.1